MMNCLYAVSLPLMHMCLDAGSEVVPVEACSDYDVRLVPTNISYKWIVEACYSTDSNSSLWGPLCTEAPSSWPLLNAVTVCKQLNFSGTSNT